MKRLLTLILSVVLVSLLQQPLSAQSMQDRYVETVRMGRGAVQHIEWQPHGELILADTIRGAWIYQPKGYQFEDVAHLEDARLARFSPDGRILAGVNAQNAITLWDTIVFAQMMSLPGHAAYVRALEWSPDGSKLASADRDGKVFVWDVASGKKVLELHLAGANKVAWSRSGRYLAACMSQSGTVRIWDSAGKQVFASSHFGSDILWRTDTQLVSLTDGEMPEGSLWDIETGKKVVDISPGYASGYNSDGSRLANSNVGRAWIADGATDTIISRIDGPQASVVKWSPNDQYIAFGDWTPPAVGEARLYIVEAATAKIVATMRFQASISQIDWNSDSTGLVIVDDASRIFEQVLDPQRRQFKTTVHTDVGALAAWRSDGQAIAAADTIDGVILWDTNTGESLVSYRSLGQAATKIAWQPNGTLLASASGNEWWSKNYNVYIWNTQSPTASTPDTVFVIPHLGPVAGITWSPDGKTLVSAERGEVLRLWSPQSPDAIHVINMWKIRNLPYIDSAESIDAVEWPSNGNFLEFSYSGYGGGGMLLVDVKSKAIVPANTPQNYASTWTWTTDHRFIWAKWGAYALAAPPTFEITVSGQGITDKSGSSLVLSGLIGQIANGIFSPDARSLIGFDALQQGIIWDIATQSARVHLSQVNNAVWSPDSTKIAMYKSNGAIEILDAQTGEVLYTFNQHFHSGLASVSVQTQVIWSPDSQKIAVLDSGALFIYEAR